MNILITAGGTSEKIDEVRQIVNTATGRLGALIADEFINKCNNASVTFLCDEASAVPESAGVKIIRVSSVDDLMNNMVKLLTNYKFDAVIHSMAVSDYKIRGITSMSDLADLFAAIESGEAGIDRDKLATMISGSNGSNKKLSSNIDDMMMLMEKTPKVISVIKKLQPETLLVGFKLLAGVSDDKLLRVGHELLVKNRCDFVFANDLEKIGENRHEGILIEPNRSYQRMNSKAEIAKVISDKVISAITPAGPKTINPHPICGFIGAGKVGVTLGKYFSINSVPVSGYFSRSTINTSAKDAADFTDSQCYETIGDIVRASDILFLTVPDGAIGDVWENVKHITVDMDISGKIFCHCSGALSSEVFDGISERGAYGYSLHPFFAVSSKLESYKEISKASFALEGDSEYLRDMQKLIAELGNPVYIIERAHKVKYHAAAVFLSNHVVAAAYTGGKLLKECGFDDDFVKNALQTLFIGNCEKIAALGAVDALTGPVERGDTATVRKHMETLGGNERALYANLSAQLADIAKQKHPSRDYSNMEILIKSEIYSRNGAFEL